MMSTPPPTPAGNVRLATALADRYRIERELGAGGMATVYFMAMFAGRVALTVRSVELGGG